ncbi:Protein ENHANCED DISEASE RESISTANCE 4 [Linum perenne]
MAEPTNVRLVRCPKCENLLPELANYSIYRCGGCGTVLRAKIGGEESREAQSEKSTEERVSGTGSTSSLQNSGEKQHEDVSEDASEVDVKSNADSSKCKEKSGIVSDNGGCKGEGSEPLSDKLVRVELEQCGVVDEVGGEHGDLNSGIRMSGGCERAERDEPEGFRRTMKTVVEDGVRFSTSKHPGEGPSSYSLPSGYGYGEPLRNRDEEVEANRAQYLEKDRAELLRKLDELKEQLSRSCEVGDKPKEKFPLGGRMVHPDPYGGSDAWFPGGSSAAPDKHATRPSYVSHHPEPFPYSRGRDMNMHNFDPSINSSRHLPGYEYPYGSQMMKRPPQQLPPHYPHGSHQYFSGHYFDGNPDVFEPYQPNAPLDLPPCSCLHCYEKHQGILPPVPPTQRYHDISKDPMFYHQENPGVFGPHNSRTTVGSFNNRGLHSHARWPSDLPSGMGGFVRSRPPPRRVALGSDVQCRRPVAGGAPFFTCSNCSELLQLPKKILAMTKNQPKIRCGSCSTVIDLAFVNQKLVLSARTDVKQASPLADDSSTEFVKHNASYSHHRMNHVNVDFSSDDYDTSGFDFQTVDTDLHPTASSIGQMLKSSRPQETQSLPSSSPSSSECEDSPDLSSSPREAAANLVQQPIRSTLATSLANSPLHHAGNRLGKGNRSSRSDQEKVTNRTATRQNSMKDASLASEMDVSFNDYGNGENFNEPGDDPGREDNQLKTGKGNESFLANIIKKSFKDFTRSNQVDDRGKISVYVNGHPVPDRVVRKAEKVAGQIHPGQYWYDYRAGFWGVMGGPGVGILPPFIEELNYPIPDNCAGGNTGVFVNGRELHQQDLDLLSTRGLPTERDRSYIIEISGRVLDEDTGEELDSLGKLAPTIERVKRGFGMKAPKSVA